MSTPIEILRREHRVIERALRTLDGICIKLQRGIEVPPETLSRLIDFIQTYADGFHHGKEEAHLFPALERNEVPCDGGIIGMMLEEHEAGRAFIAELKDAAKCYAASAGAPAGIPSILERCGASFWERGVTWNS